MMATKTPTAKQLFPLAEVFVRYGEGGHAQLGKYIKYTFTDKTASYRDNYDLMKLQCAERAALIFSLDDDLAVDTNGVIAKCGEIKKNILRLMAQQA